MKTCPPSLRSAVSRLEQSDNTPQQYIKGYVEFYKLRFKVTPDVLIPRPETELLVDEILNFLHQYQPSAISRQPFTILDLGTGSGNIAISLACNLKGYCVNIIATDISEKALRIAKQNAKFHGVENKITFIKSNLLSAFYSNTAQYQSNNNPDIIVTNLPYIPSERIPYLDSSVKDFEPHIALNGGEDGFELYRKLFQQISTLGVALGWHPRLIVGEIDYTHGELAVSEAQKLVVSEVEPYFPKAMVEVKTDLAHKQRILTITSLDIAG